jgi:hypothetical protein
MHREAKLLMPLLRTTILETEQQILRRAYLRFLLLILAILVLRVAEATPLRLESINTCEICHQRSEFCYQLELRCVPRAINLCYVGVMWHAPRCSP